MDLDPQNPVGITGFDFIEFSSETPHDLDYIFKHFGFSKLKSHHSKAIDYYRQNDIHLVLNKEPDSASMQFCKKHGPCASATGWRVNDPQKAFEIACARGAKPAKSSDYTLADGTAIPAIEGVGGSTIYLVAQDQSVDQRWQSMGFSDLSSPETVDSKGFALVDHLTNNVYQGQLEPLANFYKEVFGFTEVRYFDIDGKQTGLLSYALRSPCGSFCIPINESKDDKSQIKEYLDIYNGEGIQHIAFLTSHMLNTIAKIDREAIPTLDIDPEYYDEAFNRTPTLTEDKKAIEKHNLLVDGNKEGYLIQIFTQNLIGPIFFEFIQRRNFGGFGEGNFGALFRAIERDQEKRGVI